MMISYSCEFSWLALFDHDVPNLDSRRFGCAGWQPVEKVGNIVKIWYQCKNYVCRKRSINGTRCPYFTDQVNRQENVSYSHQYGAHCLESYDVQPVEEGGYHVANYQQD